MKLPLDIKKPWLSVIRRLQSVSHTDGWAIVSITVLVDESGCPKFWLQPKCKKIEPRRNKEELRLLFEALMEELDD